MRPPGPPERLHARRLKALALFDTGLSLNEVGRIVGCAPSSVMRWRDMRRAGGDRGLRVRFSTGRPTKLTAEERDRLDVMLRQGPRENGFRADAWTTHLVAMVIRRTFGVQYHPDSVGRIMHRLGWSFRDSLGWAA